MELLKAFSVLTVFALIVTYFAERCITASADGDTAAVTVSTEAEDEPFDLNECRSAVVYECETGTLLAGKNEHQLYSAGHLSKLMTALLAAEQIELGELSVDDTAVCSEKANSQGDPQIWLDRGEKITVDELLKAICVGNANDADVALCEKMYKSIEAFTEALNCKGKMLFEDRTSFEPSADKTMIARISAFDAAKLCSQVAKHQTLTGYYTTWMDNVRGGKVELVSRNRLIRSYKGIVGFKICFTEGVGYTAAVCAKRGDMTVCVVLMGVDDEDHLFHRCKDLLDKAFSAYEVFIPEVPEEAIARIKISHGEKSEFSVNVISLRPVVIRRGRRKDIECRYELLTEQQAPVFVGTPVGKVEYSLDGRVLTEADICSAERVDEASIGFNFRRVLLNLLKM